MAEPYPNYEYSQIFNGVPALFEYLLNAVEEKPEMLEKDDISMFKRTVFTDNNNNIEEVKNQARLENSEAGSNKYKTEPRKQEHDTDINYYPNHKYGENVNDDDQGTTSNYGISTVAYEYGNSILLCALNQDSCNMDDKSSTDQRNVRRKEENPEILEKNSIFKRTIFMDNGNNKKENKNQAINEKSDKASGGNYKTEPIEQELLSDIDFNPNYEFEENINDNESETGGNYKISTVAYEFGNSILLRDLEDDSNNVDSKNDINQDNIRSKNNIMKHKIQKRNLEERHEQYSEFLDSGYTDYDEVIWDEEDAYPAIQNIFGLDVLPEEIKEGTLLTEKLLEDYNYRIRG